MKYILSEIKLHPNLNEQDLVKLIYQRTYGPKHILTNLENSKKYLVYEFNNLPSQSYGSYEIGNNLIRVDLKEVKDIDLFFDSLVNTSKTINGTIEEYNSNIELLINCIKENNLNYNIDKIKELASLNQPVHHSFIYNKMYLPHYRIIRKDLYVKLHR